MNDSFWFYCDSGDYPPIGDPVESQDGVQVFWGGVNWWTCDSWTPHLVTSWRPHAPSAGVTGYAIGDEIHITIKGVTNDREYNSAGKILSITGNYAKVRYRQPWARPHNCMREMMVDLRACKKIKRRDRL